MKVFSTIIKQTIVAGFGILTFLAIPTNGLFAQTPCQDNDIPAIPVTTLKCNQFTFDATQSQVSNAPNASFLWDFGDGTISTQPVVTHTYQHSGDYPVRLTVNDHSSRECGTVTATRNVRASIPPHASFISVDKACPGEKIDLDASTSYSDRRKDLSYSWDFGDGETRSGAAQVSKIYSRGGDYRVRLTVDDQRGAPCSRRTAEKVIHLNEPPVAEAGDDVILRCPGGNEDAVIRFDASASRDADNDPLTYHWNFGDGQTATGMKVSHRYAEAGNYEARLVVSDDSRLGCSTDVDFVSVKIDQAPRAEAGADTLACAGEDVSFDGSRSYVRKKGTAVAEWFFGDGTSQRGLYATHRYLQPGTYQAVLSLENKLNVICPVSRDTRTVTVNAAPVANIFTRPSACVSREVFFDASSTMDTDGDDLLYYWNFGDGTSVRAGSKISHTYHQGGAHRISVVVDDQKGTSCSTATAFALIRINTPPVANAGSPAARCTREEINFTAAASSDPDGDPLTYHWDFGDGTKAQGEHVTHAYSQAGSYNVRLDVDDGKESYCSRSTDGFTAVVREVPVPAMDIR